ncbi:MAG TPA: alpha/beta fold hydrolase [Patescibacteria group bacterium]|nr:alpha/beta fold hydrolase [Patescibacteria group bacterium]
MRTIFIIHGSYGNPQENWLPWLKKELEKLGYRVFVPEFPIPKNQDLAYGGHDLSAWLATLKEYEQYIDEHTIFVAHSRGCIFMYRVLEQIKRPVAAVFLVGPWITYRWYPKGWNKIDSFHEKPFDWDKIKKGSRYFEIYQSTNDDTPVTEGKDLAQKLDAQLIIVKDAGHFNVAYHPRFKKFDQLLENIKNKL